ncbi:MAG: endonuclease domain-containing protein [Actinomycetota bacterium]
MNEVERRIAAVAEKQHGVVDRATAIAYGMKPRTLNRRGWEQLFPAVYRMPGTPRTGRQLAIAASIWGGEESLISHTTAGRLLRLDGIRTTSVHLTLPYGSTRRSPRVTVHHGPIPLIDRTWVDGIRCTTATRALIDCAHLLDSEALETVFESARRMGLASPDMLAHRAAELCGRGRPGSRAIHRLVAVQQLGNRALESRLEVKAWRLLRASGLTLPHRQFPVGPYRLDFAWCDNRFDLEAEGYEFHGNRLRWKRDKRRTAYLEARGWRVMFVTWDDVTKHPEETLERIGLALRPSR